MPEYRPYRVLNLYAGLGGNVKDWDDCEIVSVEMDKNIAELYSELHPDDNVVVGDAHQYLLEHYSEFDFIWASPPCQSHSRMIRSGRNRKPRYPDFKMYEEIVFLQHNFDGLWVVENVVPYYEPPVAPTIKMGRHLFWSNFGITPFDPPEFSGFIKKQNLSNKQELMDWLGLHYSRNVYYDGNHCPTQILRNCVHPDLGRHVFDCAAAARMTPAERHCVNIIAEMNTGVRYD